MRICIEVYGKKYSQHTFIYDVLAGYNSQIGYHGYDKRVPHPNEFICKVKVGRLLGVKRGRGSCP